MCYLSFLIDSRPCSRLVFQSSFANKEHFGTVVFPPNNKFSFLKVRNVQRKMFTDLLGLFAQNHRIIFESVGVKELSFASEEYSCI